MTIAPVRVLCPGSGQRVAWDGYPLPPGYRAPCPVCERLSHITRALQIRKHQPPRTVYKTTAAARAAIVAARVLCPGSGQRVAWHGYPYRTACPVCGRDSHITQARQIHKHQPPRVEVEITAALLQLAEAIAEPLPPERGTIEDLERLIARHQAHARELLRRIDGRE